MSSLLVGSFQSLAAARKARQRILLAGIVRTVLIVEAVRVEVKVWVNGDGGSGGIGGGIGRKIKKREWGEVRFYLGIV